MRWWLLEIFLVATPESSVLDVSCLLTNDRHHHLYGERSLQPRGAAERESVLLECTQRRFGLIARVL